MGGGGFALHALKTIRQNRSLLKKKGRSKKTKEEVYGKQNLTQLSLKTSIPKDMAAIRKKIAIQKRKNLRATLWAAVATIFLFVLLFWWLS
ncbi:hypothetical protein [Flagellimonas lutaonensis]|uniref:Uncharacterized protein n=1 Tax=Flagellimonas lutaonensis TaxID=516051 RepID=A0A0D5YV98_9FLAO|nr:hypothetical protein [Allomuricauda lutaonensis]AKA36242.1 hypothetical protein VC82_2682 [Allomuricauda lutaonensis]